MAIVFSDFHHGALAESLRLLFEERFGDTLYFPHGMEWFDKGYWKIGDPYGDTARFTALQFLAGALPTDGTGVVKISRAMTLDQFIHTPIDVIIASYNDHIPVYKELRDTYHPNAQLITHYGNAWEDHPLNEKVLASISPFPTHAPACFYHQEFDTSLFFPAGLWERTNLIATFSNALSANPLFTQDYADFKAIQRLLQPHFRVQSFGGSCENGSLSYPHEVSHKMRQCSVAIHLKKGGDGYGHTIFSLAACGVPIIFRGSQYKGKLAERFLLHGITGWDLDQISIEHLCSILLKTDYATLYKMGQTIYTLFQDSVDFKAEGERIRAFIYG